MRWHRVFALLTGIATTVAAVVVGNVVFEGVAVGDPCDYHNGVVETTWLFDLYFPMTSANGYHPEPGLLFHLTTLALGIGAGVLVSGISIDASKPMNIDSSRRE